jgi:hypothetical protein
MIFSQPIREPITGTADWDWVMETGFPMRLRSSDSSVCSFLVSEFCKTTTLVSGINTKLFSKNKLSFETGKNKSGDARGIIHLNSCQNLIRDKFSQYFTIITHNKVFLKALNGGKVVDNKNGGDRLQYCQNVILVNYEKGDSDYSDRSSNLHCGDSRHGI